MTRLASATLHWRASPYIARARGVVTIMAEVFLRFLASLEPTTRAECWRGRPHTALVTLRMLEPLQQQLVVRLLFGDQLVDPNVSATALTETGIASVRACLLDAAVLIAHAESSLQLAGDRLSLQAAFAEALQHGLAVANADEWEPAMLPAVFVPQAEKESAEVRPRARMCRIATDALRRAVAVGKHFAVRGRLDGQVRASRL